MSASSAVLDVTDADFQQSVLERSKTLPVVVDFWAPWCGPCRVLGPIIERVGAEHAGQVALVKLNTDENPRTAMTYRIQGIPAVKAFVDGKVAAEFVGAIPEPQVRAFFTRILPPKQDEDGAGARESEPSGDAGAAEAGYRSALAAQPGNVEALVGLAALLAARGDRDEAERLLERAPADRRAKSLKHRLFLQDFAARHEGEDLEGGASRNPTDARARYRWGVMLAAREQYEAALEELLESVRLDRNLAEGAARKAALAVFDLLGLDSPVTKEYQRQLSRLLF